MTERLFVYRQHKVMLKQAIAAFVTINGKNGATAILYAPRRCELATFAKGSLHGWDGQLVDISTVFEARVFSETAELRWLNDPSPEQCHRAVILSEQVQTQLNGWQMEQEKAVITTLPQTYLLWGEGTGREIQNGWSELATARIGALKVPVNKVGKNERVLLHSLEYIVEAEHGNAAIFDERLVKLEVARG